MPGRCTSTPRTPSGADSLDPADVAAVVAAVRAAVPGVPVGVTTGAWALPDPAERVAAVRAWTGLPDFASVNWHEDGADDVAAALLDRGVQVEAGLWHLDGVAAWQASPHRDRCLRVLLELPDGLDEAGTEAEAERLLAAVGEGPPVLLHGEGTSCWPALRAGRCAAVWTPGSGWRTCCTCPTARRHRTTPRWSGRPSLRRRAGIRRDRRLA